MLVQSAAVYVRRSPWSVINVTLDNQIRAVQDIFQVYNYKVCLDIQVVPKKDHKLEGSKISPRRDLIIKVRLVGNLSQLQAVLALALSSAPFLS